MTTRLRFADFVHHLIIDDELIILDECRDCYHLLNKNQTREIIRRLGDAAEVSCKVEDFSACSALIRRGVLVESECAGDLRIVDAKILGVGCYSAETIFFPGDSKACDIVLPSIWLTLSKMCLAIFGFHRTLQLCRVVAKRQTLQMQSPEHLMMIVSRIKIAASYSPFKAKCLERSIAAFLWASKRRIACRLRLGVQRYDFLAHAWVASEDGPIGERSDLEDLLPILVEI